MQVTKTSLEGLLIITPKVFEDHRGFFMEAYSDIAFRENGLHYDFVQDNQSLSVHKGVLRGLHYQLSPNAQAKLVRVLKGSIFDVAVDIRKNSPTFGKWFGVELSEKNKKQLLVPRGFAHGFCTLEDNTEVSYKTDGFYSKEHDRGILWNDPSIGVDWGIDSPILSEKDTHQPLLKDAEINFEKEVLR